MALRVGVQAPQHGHADRADQARLLRAHTRNAASFGLRITGEGTGRVRSRSGRLAGWAVVLASFLMARTLQLA